MGSIFFIMALGAWGMIAGGFLAMIFAFASMGFIRARTIKEWESTIFLLIVASALLALGAYTLGASMEWRSYAR